VVVTPTQDAGRGLAGQAGRDYPRTRNEFRQLFIDADACAAYLESLRWPTGFVCPDCDAAGTAWRQTRGRLVCSRCRSQTTATAGTILDKTRTALTTWFEAAWLVTTAKNGLSAKTLERTLGVSYRTAWAILHRFRVAMVRAEREPLHGEVEVDETFVGGAETGGKRGRGTDKEVVVIAVEVLHPKGFGRVRMRRVPSAEGAHLVGFVREAVAPGSKVHTDGWRGYNALSRNGFQHGVTNISASGDPAHVTMPAVHRVASLLKRWILGTHQGSFTAHHLQAYLEEFTFRFNRRTSRSRGLVFRRLVEQMVVTGPITAADLAHGYDWGTPQDMGVGGAN
jgi:transposase-like protein